MKPFGRSPNSTGGGPASAPEYAISPRLRILTALALIPVALYTVACLAFNAPDSPVKSRVQGLTNRAMQPYFWQDWQLFGPTPGSNNDLIYMTVRMKSAGSNKIVETTPVEIEDAIDRTPRKFPLNPTKLPGLPLAFDAAANRYAGAVTNFKKLPEADRKSAQDLLDKQYAPEFKELQRFLSSQAESMYPDAQVMSVRATFKVKAMTPFSARYANPKPKESAKAILETSWMNYVPGVAG
ncbi:DUF5819 family protein [Streptomyces sp. NBC_01465]|uniref:DUF5819 family protein n=1 Tax=Streptomyces sp. NBC_01465 TaxID=2903878 RepID=UPI002E3588EA|nr:DUF5819 family protein [Streptomyces sp. NBC_01465]